MPLHGRDKGERSAPPPSRGGGRNVDMAPRSRADDGPPMRNNAPKEGRQVTSPAVPGWLCWPALARQGLCARPMALGRVWSCDDRLCCGPACWPGVPAV